MFSCILCDWRSSLLFILTILPIAFPTEFVPPTILNNCLANLPRSADVAFSLRVAIKLWLLGSRLSNSNALDPAIEVVSPSLPSSLSVTSVKLLTSALRTKNSRAEY